LPPNNEVAWISRRSRPFRDCCNIAISLKTLSAGVAREREVGEAVIIKPEGSDAKSESWGLEDLFERPQISRQTRMAQLDGKEIDPAGRKRRGPAGQRKQQVPSIGDKSRGC